MIVGLDTSDDAAVYRINDETAAILTLDFFTPVVDDPYTFGQIAAANSLSDVYAMGGKPVTAMNITCFPSCLPMTVLGEILRGGADKVKEAGGVLVGGHTVEDDEPKYGLSVMGLVHPKEVYANAGAKPGDMLVLTKPVGLGILNTAIKADLASPEVCAKAVFNMAYLNKDACEAMVAVGGNACTDITGFGLLGHAYEMADGSKVSLEIWSDYVPVLEESLEFARMGIIPAGMYSNEGYLSDKVHFVNTVKTELRDVLFDPQTSGGLLIALPEEKVDALMNRLRSALKTDFNVIGRVKEKGLYPIEIL